MAAMPLAALPLPLGPIQLPMTELILPFAAIAVVLARVRASECAGSATLTRSEVWAVALFLVAALLSLLVTEYPRQSLRELRLLIVEPVAWYLLLRSSALDTAWMTRAVTAFVVVAAMMAALAFGLALGGRGLVDAEGVQRLIGVYPSANHFALVLDRAIPFSLALVLAGGRHRAAFAAATAVLLIALVGTFSGGGWLGTAAAVLVVVWLTQGSRPALALLALGGAAAVLALAVLRVERIASRLDPTRGTGFIRVKLWEASLGMVRDHPVLGIGLDNFLYRYQQEYLPAEAAVEPNLSHPHNWALHFWLSLGVLGLVAVIWLLLQFLEGVRGVLTQSTDPAARALAIGAAGSMVSFLVHGAVDNSYFLPDMALIFWFTLAVPRSVGVRDLGDRGKGPLSPAALPLIPNP
jgi:O-antigen ligase